MWAVGAGGSNYDPGAAQDHSMLGCRLNISLIVLMLLLKPTVQEKIRPGILNNNKIDIVMDIGSEPSSNRY